MRPVATTRRGLLAGGGLLLLGGLLPRPTAAQLAGRALLIQGPDRPGSLADGVIRLYLGGFTGPGQPPAELLADGGEAALGRALAALVAYQPGNDPVPLLVAQLLPLVRLNPKPPPESLTPLAKLTGAVSQTLVVREGGTVADWAGFAALPSPTVLAADIEAPALALLQKALGRPLQRRAEADVAALVDAVAEGRADAGLLPTPTVIGLVDRLEGVLPLLSFGGERNPALQVPTLRDVTGDRKAATSDSIGLFGPPALEAEAVADIVAAFRRAAAEPALQREAAAQNLPLAVGDGTLLLETLARDRAVLARVAS